MSRQFFFSSTPPSSPSLSPPSSPPLEPSRAASEEAHALPSLNAGPSYSAEGATREYVERAAQQPRPRFGNQNDCVAHSFGAHAGVRTDQAFRRVAGGDQADGRRMHVFYNQRGMNGEEAEAFAERAGAPIHTAYSSEENLRLPRAGQASTAFERYPGQDMLHAVVWTRSPSGEHATRFDLQANERRDFRVNRVPLSEATPYSVVNTTFHQPPQRSPSPAPSRSPSPPSSPVPSPPSSPRSDISSSPSSVSSSSSYVPSPFRSGGSSRDRGPSR